MVFNTKVNAFFSLDSLKNKTYIYQVQCCSLLKNFLTLNKWQFFKIDDFVVNTVHLSWPSTPSHFFSFFFFAGLFGLHLLGFFTTAGITGIYEKAMSDGRFSCRSWSWVMFSSERSQLANSSTLGPELVDNNGSTASFVSAQVT